MGVTPAPSESSTQAPDGADPPPRAGRPGRRTSLLAGVAVLAVGAGLVAAVAGSAVETVGTVVRPVAVATRPVVVRDGYPVARTVLGRIEPRREARLAFGLPGVLADVLVEGGDAVQAGQTSARLDTAKSEARRGQSAAALAAAEAVLAELVAGPRGEAVAAAAAEAARLKALAERACGPRTASPGWPAGGA